MPAHRPSSLRRVAASLATAAIVVSTAGCSLLEDDSDGATETPDTIVAARPVELAALQALLPPPGDIGPGYVEEVEEPADPNQPSDDPFGDMLDAELRKTCPEAAEVMDPEGVEPGDGSSTADSVSRTYRGPGGEHFGVNFENGEQITDRAEFLALIDAAELCETISLTHPNGVEIKVTLDAELDDTYGDWGGMLRLNLVQQHPSFPAPVSMWFEYRMFLVGSVGVTVSAGDSSNPADASVLPRNTEKVEALAAIFEMTVAALQMETAPTTTTSAAP